MSRDAEKEKFWREKMEEYEKSGVTVREFCVRDGLREAPFYYWRRKLKGRSKKKTGFVELIRRGGQAVTAGVSIRIDERLSIVVDRGFDGGTLQAALACVCARACGR